MAVSGNFSKLSVAPMMDWTDRHCRLFLRMLSPHARLYAEMVTAAALIHGDAEKLLRFNPAEHPVALQLGGCDPRMMADAAAQGVLDLISQLLINQQGFDVDFGEHGLRMGCP